ncbi:hypothetical protein DQ384_11385 [Sphaerisporangium album]|uniref:DUF6294 domain-containing protein n=1 Tax=Sphaerisporangium album TaxID=509200 RepID=A0A367FM22_9ACTN|nr:DUF6294 family protein [Sphaerisporangium album]RCG31311.1 hypothetical protein DQ384_11385 [Sphaerisporangium album]
MAATLGALTLGLALPATGTANATAYKKYTWNSWMSAGDCYLYPGASWTIYPNGTAQLDATVSSSDGDDAWLMWAHLKDANFAVLADIRVYGSTSTKFVKGLPVANRRYRWFAEGRFDPALYPLIKHMSLNKHC